MSRLSRQKGKLGERQWRDELRFAGYTARRGQQFAGGTDSPDVICDELGCVHFEVKIGKAPPVYPAMLQAIRDGGPRKIPIVASRKDRSPVFLVTMEGEAFFALLRDGIAGLEKLAELRAARIGAIAPKILTETTETGPAQRQSQTDPASQPKDQHNV